MKVQRRKVSIFFFSIRIESNDAVGLNVFFILAAWFICRCEVCETLSTVGSHGAV